MVEAIGYGEPLTDGEGLAGEAGRGVSGGVVEQVSDGDTLTLRSGSRRLRVRLLGIDAPELNYRGQSQRPWAETALQQLRRLTPPGSRVSLVTDRQEFDQYGRLLAFVMRGRQNVNLELLRSGWAVAYVIYPNVRLLSTMLAATATAEAGRRGIFNPRAPLPLLPYEFRQQVDARPPAKFCGDFRTRQYYAPQEYQRVPVARRVFFYSEAEARAFGFSPAGAPALLAVEAAAGEIGALAVARPRIHTTSEWNARPPRQAITVLGSRPTEITVHHTTHDNVADFSLTRAFRVARGIQGSHMGERGFIDTGQHFTISRGGHIMEGRHRSLEVATRGQGHVLGAHAGGCNRTAVGIENEGTYTRALPPDTQWQALVSLCAWLCQQYGIPTARIRGHRQCAGSSTQCPGDALFARLPDLRRDVAAKLSAAPSAVAAVPEEAMPYGALI